jgi:hypothetical protein
MIGKGLKFAKATPGDEPYYEALYQQLATFEIGLNRHSSRLSSPERTTSSNSR